MDKISLLIKPVSSGCNLKCDYCFYIDESEKRTVKNYGIMQGSTVDIILQKAFSENFKTVEIAFQGGEPTLAGIDFYKEFVKKIKFYNKNNIPFFLSIQTNGYVIDDNWAQFFTENNFLVGISLDGTEDVHNAYRHSSNGIGSFERVMKSIHCLKKYNVQFNILSVVTGKFAENIDEILKFYIKNNFYYLQFIPCLEPLSEIRGNKEYSLNPKEYAVFLCKVFDFWFYNLINGRHIYIRFFEDILFNVVKAHCPGCSVSGKCKNQMVIEADGSVYPCDFYVLDEYKIGNVHSESLKSLQKKGDEGVFVNTQVNQNCKDCRYYSWCRGGCKRDYQNKENYFCKSYKTFFEYAERKYIYISQMI